MSFNYFENTVLPDDWVISFDKIPGEADQANAVRRITKGLEKVKSDLDGLGGIKLQMPKADDLFNELIKEQSHAVSFELILSKSEFRLNAVVGKTTHQVGKVSPPSDLEDYRTFLGNLNGWSQGDHDLVPNSDFKKWNEANPKKPTVYKDFEEMVKKSKSDVDDFRTWSKKNSKAGKAFTEYDKTAKLKPTDPARTAAMKGMNEALKDYYKSF